MKHPRLVFPVLLAVLTAPGTTQTQLLDLNQRMAQQSSGALNCWQAGKYVYFAASERNTGREL